MLVAPFTGRIRDPASWREWVAELGGDPVRLVWVGCDEPSLRRRLEERALERDVGKLAAFDAFTARMRPAVPPDVPHLAVDNSTDGRDGVEAQLRRLLATS